MNTKGEVLASLAEVCGEQLTPSRTKAYLFAMKDLSLEELKGAVWKLMNDSSLTRFPMPGKIIEMARPTNTLEDAAKESAARIVHAVAKFGHPNRSQARDYIGALGWNVVEMQGGWGHLCESMRDSRIPMLQAQFRELAKTVHQKARLGTLDVAPSLPEPTDKNTKQITSLLKIKGVGE
jgi:hypothetical protein